MITSRLMGGLGNQMFQIAAAHALALRNGDTSTFDLSSCFTPNQGNSAPAYEDNVLSRINKSTMIPKNRYIEPKFGYSEIPYSENMIIDGYFQSERYFKDYEKEIINLFKIDLKDIFKISYHFDAWGVTSKPTTSIHIRRGDYLKNQGYYKMLDVDYYKKAMELIGDSNFIFVSDDIEWVKENFVGEDFIYSPFKGEVLDLTLMTMCDNNIISNSSFSWWGAYLNPTVDKKVVAPKEWFGAHGHKDTDDTIPNNWIKI